MQRINAIDLGFPLAVEEQIADFIVPENVHLHPGHIAVLYTDGISETEDINGLQYGIEQLIAVIRLHRQLSATQIEDAVIQPWRRLLPHCHLFDDITLLVIVGSIANKLYLKTAHQTSNDHDSNFRGI